MSVIKDTIYALKGVVIPLVLILVGAMIVSDRLGTHDTGIALIGLGMFVAGMSWFAYLSFLARD